MQNIERTIRELDDEGFAVVLQVMQDPDAEVWRARLVDVNDPLAPLFDPKNGDLSLDVTAGTMAQAIAEIDARCAL